MDWTPVIDALSKAMITILTAGITALSAYALVYINKLAVKAKSQTDSINNEATRALAEQAINRIQELAYSAVKCIQQELVADIKAGIESGKYSRDDLLALKDKAVQDVIAQLTPQMQEAAKAQISDLEAYVGNVVSSFVYDLKQEEAKKVTVTATTADCATPTEAAK